MTKTAKSTNQAPSETSAGTTPAKQQDQSAAPLQIIVLGMHRSGTSVLTGALSRMGVHVGDDEELTGRSWENPTGYFERRDTRKICDDLLHGSGADWWKISAFDPDEAGHRAVRKSRSAISELVDRLDSQNQPWVLKEPRLCLLFPIFRSALTRPFALVAYRHPVEVAQSLRRRNGFPITAGLALWEAYTVAALTHASALPHALVGYHELLDAPRPTLDRMAGALEKHGAGSLDLKAGEQIIDASLRRERFSDETLAERMTPAQRNLWESLNGARSIGTIPDLSASALKTLREFEVDETERRELHADIQSLRTTLAKSKEKAEANPEALAAAERRIKELGGKIADLEGERGQLLERRDDLSANLHRKESQLETLRKELAEAEAAIKSGKTALADAQREAEAARLARSKAEFKSADLEKEAQRLSATACAAEAKNEGLWEALAERTKAAEAAETRRRSAETRLRSAEKLKAADLASRIREAEAAAAAIASDISAAARPGLRGRLWKRGSDRRRNTLIVSALFDAGWYLETNPDVREAGADPIEHYLRKGASEGRLPHPLFDPRHFESQGGASGDAHLTPLEKYLRAGAEAEASPHPLFDSRWYMQRNARARETGLTPLEHYLRVGVFEGADPHPWFSTRFYLEKYPDVAVSGMNPLCHFVAAPAKEGRDPCERFSTRKYVKRHQDVAAAAINPLIHYVTAGQAEGRRTK